MPQPSLTRRDGLRLIAIGGAAGLALAACSSSGSEPAASSAAATSDNDDLSARDEASLIAEYDAVLAAFPNLAAEAATLVRGIRDQHAAHRDALGGSPDAPAAQAPSSESAALAALARLEREAARSRAVACADAADPERARILALIAASEAAHVPALKGLA